MKNFLEQLNLAIYILEQVNSEIEISKQLSISIIQNIINSFAKENK